MKGLYGASHELGPIALNILASLSLPLFLRIPNVVKYIV
jgi:hypothetical protein